MQSMSPGGVLELVLQQVFQRAYIEGLVIESFTVQQEIHQELSKHKEMPSLSTSAARNMNKLLSRMNWCRMMHFVKSNPGCEQSFLDGVQMKLACLRQGEVRNLPYAKSVWL
ncbi:unnamed protein product [Symbiodinium pilosum]|uniref:Uncharacterized protein n=1 Tax=Symbiodinium pilosum TaxID=2952 RepID=A0A812PVY5_SYMPI|nr:unnamed protein product [Symbiodinium pilosum]